MADADAITGASVKVSGGCGAGSGLLSPTGKSGREGGGTGMRCSAINSAGTTLVGRRADCCVGACAICSACGVIGVGLLLGTGRAGGGGACS